MTVGDLRYETEEDAPPQVLSLIYEALSSECHEAGRGQERLFIRTLFLSYSR